jgi:DNA-binding transcriptional regulator YiaG
VILHGAPGYRCSTCHAETVDGTVINGVLHALALEVAKMPRRLPADHARFLRKHLRLSQQALANRMCVDRVTVADWERGASPISPHHDFILRGIAMAEFMCSSEDLQLTDLAAVIGHARSEAPMDTPPPFVMDKALERLRAEQTWR